MEKVEILDKIHYLIDRPEFRSLSEDQLASVLQLIMDTAFKEKKSPFFKTGKFSYYRVGYINENEFSVTVVVLDETYLMPSKKDLEQVMDYYGVRGSVRFSFTKGYQGTWKGAPPRFSFVIIRPGAPNAESFRQSEFSPGLARILNLKAEGRTQQEIAKAEGCSLVAVTDNLRWASLKSKRYGFWQLWPDSVEMLFTDDEYAKALITRGRRKKEK